MAYNREENLELVSTFECYSETSCFKLLHHLFVLLFDLCSTMFCAHLLAVCHCACAWYAYSLLIS